MTQCFVAAVVNLRSILPSIKTRLSLETKTWQQVIIEARSLWNERYSADDGNGQHDAADLLGDILWEDAFAGVRVRRHTSTRGCQHQWTTEVSYKILPLELPQRLRAHTTRSLFALHAQAFIAKDLQCATCHTRDQIGNVQLQIVDPMPEILVLRVNRYTEAGARRHDAVKPDLVFACNGSAYTLVAVISHIGENPHSGHYTTALATAAGWESRDDGVKRTSARMPCDPTHVYVLVYRRGALHPDAAPRPAHARRQPTSDDKSGLPSCQEEDREESAATESEADALSSSSATSDDFSDEDDVFIPLPRQRQGCSDTLAQSPVLQWHEATVHLACHLRDNLTLPLHPEVSQNAVVFTQLSLPVQLPLWHCPFRDCEACAPAAVISDNYEMAWWDHVWSHPAHGALLREFVIKKKLSPSGGDLREAGFALLIAAMILKEQDFIPLVGHATDRRSLRHLGEVFQEESIKTLMCFICGGKHIYHCGFNKFGFSRLSIDDKRTFQPETDDETCSRPLYQREYISRNPHSSPNRLKHH